MRPFRQARSGPTQHSGYDGFLALAAQPRHAGQAERMAEGLL